MESEGLGGGLGRGVWEMNSTHTDAPFLRAAGRHPCVIGSQEGRLGARLRRGEVERVGGGDPGQTSSQKGAATTALTPRANASATLCVPRGPPAGGGYRRWVMILTAVVAVTWMYGPFLFQASVPSRTPLDHVRSTSSVMALFLL